MMKKTKRLYVLLFEVLIGMTLITLLLSTLIGFYFQINQINTAMEKEQAYNFKKLYLSTRLAAILPNAISSPKSNAKGATSSTDPNKDYIFYSSMASDSFTKSGTQVLMLTFDNGVSLNPAFSNHILGRLYVNTNDQLCLASWPSPLRWDDISFPPIKYEVLFDNVEDLEFQFFVPPIKDRKKILSNNKLKGAIKENPLLVLGPFGEWREDWQQEFNELPPLVRLKLKVKGIEKSLTFVYPLPQSRFIIVYE